jgi:two-component system cell cycle sensor histidine kinase/response regulator CckA
MFELDDQLPALRQRIRRLVGNRIEVRWVRGCPLDSVIGEPDTIEQAILEMALRSRAAMPFGGMLLVESCNLELDDSCSVNDMLPAGRYVMFEMTCLRKSPTDVLLCETLPLDAAADESWRESGLGSSSEIVRSIGGAICEYNEPGRSLTLRIFLPSAARIVYSDEEGFTVTQTAGNDTILLVEDEGYVRDVACEILESAGYTVITATTAGEALAMFEQYGPVALLVTDVVMPGMNGRDLSLRLTSRQPGLKTIYMSGYTDNAVIRHDFEAHSHTYLQKPFTMETLTNKVKEVLASRNGIN